MTEPNRSVDHFKLPPSSRSSLSSDLAASLQATTATISSLFRSLKELSHTVDVDSNMKAARLDALEKKTNGFIQTRADHGHQFIVIIDRVKALEERVAALEELLVEAELLIPSEPLPKEDLD